MGTTYSPRYSINGVIDTAQPVMRNIENIATSAGSWVTYDAAAGQWAVIINKPYDTIAGYFDEDNIIGNVTYTETGLDQLYNAVEAQYANTDLQQQNDYVRIDIPVGDLLPVETENVLKINYPLVDNPIQAELLAFIELKQSRVDRLLQFTTDYEYVGVKAGDVIDVTLPIYNLSNAKFRVTRVEENDTDAFTIKITALEYDADVYDESNLIYYLRTNQDGIVTIGDIGQCGVPQVTKTEVNSRPHLKIETTLPLTDPGLVEGVEFWWYKIPDAELPNWELVDDDTRNYQLYETVRLQQGAIMDPGEEVQLDIDNVDPGNFLVKCRAVNSTTVGPFSEYSGLVEYDPTQITDAIGPGTDLVDGGGDSLLSTLGLSVLLELLNGLLANNDTGSGSMWEDFWNLFETDTGQDLRGLASNNTQFMVSAQSGATQVVIPADARTITNYDTEWATTGRKCIYLGPLFTAPFTGTYKIDVIMDQNQSACSGGRGTAYGEHSDALSVGVELYSPSSPIGIGDFVISTNRVAGEASGGLGTQYWTDYAMTTTVNLTAGQTYQTAFSYKLINNVSYLFDINISWNIYIT